MSRGADHGGRSVRVGVLSSAAVSGSPASEKSRSRTACGLIGRRSAFWKNEWDDKARDPDGGVDCSMVVLGTW